MDVYHPGPKFTVHWMQKGDLVRIVLFAPFEDGDALVEMLHEFQRKRSASGKNLAQLRVDPYSI
jgi:primosomal protein N' (replication factor Y)